MGSRVAEGIRGASVEAGTSGREHRLTRAQTPAGRRHTPLTPPPRACRCWESGRGCVEADAVRRFPSVGRDLAGLHVRLDLCRSTSKSVQRPARVRHQGRGAEPLNRGARGVRWPHPALRRRGPAVRMARASLCRRSRCPWSGSLPACKPGISRRGIQLSGPGASIAIRVGS